TSQRRGRKGLLEAAQRLAEIKNLIRQRHDEFPQKILLKVLTVFPGGRIVRFFAAAEAADELKSIAQNVGNIEIYLDRWKKYFIIRNAL
ncbi:hypothetical protein, partial [Neisseria viridiae]